MRAPLGIHKRKSLAYVFVGHKQAKLSADFVVVAHFCVFELLDILVKIGFFLETRAVNTREHLVFFVAFPVRAGERCEFERLDFSGRRKVRACAKVDEIALLIKGYLLVLRNIRQKLRLVDLFHLCNAPFRLFASAFYAGYGHIRFDYALHFRLDFGKIRLGYGRSEIEIVIKTVVNGRAYGKLNGGIDVFDRLRQNMRASMAINSSAFFVLKSEQFKIAIFVDKRIHRAYDAVNPCMRAHSLQARHRCVLPPRTRS